MNGPRTGGILAILVFATLCGCYGTSTSRRSTGVLDFLYPEGSAAAPAEDVALTLPVRVGMAFAPRGTMYNDYPEASKVELLERIGAAFEKKSFIESVEILPSHYLQETGGYDNLDQLRSAFGIDLVVLLSYDQTQLTKSNNWSITYLTVVGAYLVEGDENTTLTLLDAVVVDIPSRALLFRAAGTSKIEDQTTAAGAARSMQETSQRGFDDATEKLIEQLDLALAEFSGQALQGTVRGMGTPEITINSEDGVVIDGNYGGGGAFGLAEGGFVALLVALGVLGRRRDD